MKRKGLSFAAAALLALGFCALTGAQVEWEDVSRGNIDSRAVLFDPYNPKVMFLGAKRGVSRSDDFGSSWRVVKSIPGGNRKVNFLSFGVQDNHSVYAATGAGLYYSANQGKDWQRIFRGKNTSEAEGTALAVLPGKLCLGTKSGLFISADNAASWHKAEGKLELSHILSIACHPKDAKYVYLACVDGVYRSKDSAETWERIFDAQPHENGNEDKDEVEGEDGEERFSKIRYLSIDPNNPACLYLATSWGIYKSVDKGESWLEFSDYGLTSRIIDFITVSGKSDIYCVAGTGIFVFRAGRWEELSVGLASGEVRFLALDGAGNIYASCARGLFRAKLVSTQAIKKQRIMELYTQGEPKINEVQRIAMKYAEVEPEKIMRWRKQAGKRAWLPKFNAGVNRDTSDLWHWESGSSTKTYDDVLVRGNDAIGWDVNLSWDLADLIWSEDQVSIDVRSRLMVQLRDDVLDEVTKLYFERLRVKMELDNLSIEDRKQRFEKELRLEELTASIDSFTGGYFSGQIRKNKTSS